MFRWGGMGLALFIETIVRTVFMCDHSVFLNSESAWSSTVINVLGYSWWSGPMTGEGGDTYVIYRKSCLLTLTLHVPTLMYILYYVDELKQTLAAVLNISRGLGPITALTAVTILVHYFVYQMIYSTYEIANTQGSGFGCEVTPDSNTTEAMINCISYSEPLEGFYQLFVLMTTANHPDILMGMVDHAPVFAVLIMSYMSLVTIVLMNLLLALVTDTFEFLTTHMREGQAEIRSAMFQTAFYGLAALDNSTPDTSSVSADLILQVMTDIDKYQNLANPIDTLVNFFLTCIGIRDSQNMSGKGALKDNKATLDRLQETLNHFGLRADPEDLSVRRLVLEMCNFNDRSSQTIDIEEFRTMMALYHVPFVIRGWDDTQSRYYAHLLGHHGEEDDTARQEMFIHLEKEGCVYLYLS